MENKPLENKKVQLTLRGYEAFVLDRLMEEKGHSLADVASFVVELWVDGNEKYLNDLGITREQWKMKRAGKGEVIQISDATGDRTDR